MEYGRQKNKDLFIVCADKNATDIFNNICLKNRQSMAQQVINMAERIIKQGEIVYSISEDALSGYVQTITCDGGVYTITNSYAEGKTSVSVRKAWDDMGDQDGQRPAETIIELIANGATTGQTITLNPSNGWNGTFTNLDERLNDKKISYTVTEQTVDGYVNNISGNMTEGYTLTSTHTIRAYDDARKDSCLSSTANGGSYKTMDINVVKVWDDGEHDKGLVTARLWGNGKLVDSVTLNSANDWSYTFTGLPKHVPGCTIPFPVDDDALMKAKEKNGEAKLMFHMPPKFQDEFIDAAKNIGLTRQVITRLYILMCARKGRLL